MTAPWLTLVGIGEDGRAGLSPRGRAALDGAALVVGGTRHLALAAPLACETLAWPSPIEHAIDRILEQRGQPVVVLATGDPFHYGVGTMIASRVPSQEIVSLPQPSAFALAASKLCWSLQDTKLVSLHGRDDSGLAARFADRARLIILSWDGSTPAKVAQMLTQHGFGRSRMIVLEAMGGPREKIRESDAASFAFVDIDPLNTIAVECLGEGPAASPQTVLADDAFAHDGQITKQDIRAVTLAALAPRGNERLWDVGAGSGSVALEWLRMHPDNSALAFETRADRAARILENATRLRVRSPQIIDGRAPDSFTGLAAPDAIFIGGGASAPDMIPQAMNALKSGGRLVANAVTIETQALLAKARGEHGGHLLQIQLSEAAPVGRFSGWKAAMPIVQWRWQKP